MAETPAPADLATPRLLLKAATLEMLRADVRNDRIELRQLVGAFIPDSWPPAYFADNRERFAATAAATPGREGWNAWYMVNAGEQKLMGAVWVEHPGPEGDCEAGYAILDKYRGQGYTPEAMNAVLGWAFSHAEVKRIVAHTFPHVVPAIRVLEKAGFTRATLTSDGICVYEKRR